MRNVTTKTVPAARQRLRKRERWQSWCCAVAFWGSVTSIHWGCSRPEAPPDHLAAGFELLDDDPRQAISEFQKDKNNPSQRAYGLALAHEALGQLDQASSYYDKAIEADGKLVLAQTGKARIRIFQGQIARAHQDLAKIVASQPAYLAPLLLQALTADSPAQLSEVEAAFRTYRRVRGENEKDTVAQVLVESWILERQGKPTNKKRLARSLNEARLDDTDSLLVLAELALRLERGDLSSQLVRRLPPSQLSSVQARQATDLLIEGRQAQAAGPYAAKIALYPEVAENFLTLARYHLARDRIPEAARELSRAQAALKKQGDSKKAATSLEEALFLSAQIDFRRGDLKKAHETLQRLDQAHPGQPATEFVLAQVELALGLEEGGKGLSRLQSLVARHPREEAFVTELVGFLQKSGGLKDADAVLERWRKRDPENLEIARLQLGNLHRQKDTARLASFSKRLIDDLGPRAEVLHTIGTFYFEVGLPSSAVALFSSLSAEQLGEEGALLLASAQQKSQREADAKKTLLSLTESHPSSERAWLSLARLDEVKGRLSEAEDALLSCLKHHPKSLTALTHLASIQQRSKRAEDAAATYEKVLALRPEDALTMNNLAFIYTENLDRPQEAVKWAQRAYRLRKDPAIADTLGWALLAANNPKDRESALKLLERAASELETSDVQRHHAMALLLNGKQAEADAILARLGPIRDADTKKLVALMSEQAKAP